MTHTKFHIIATGWNCAKFVRRCIASVIGQQYSGEFHLHLISDGSTDGTGAELVRDKSMNTTCYVSHENKGAAYRRWQVIQELRHEPGNEDAVIILMGMDDELLPGALERIDQEYQLGKLMTYGNWKNQRGIGLPQGFNLYFDSITHRNRDYRKVQYRSTAPNTFRLKLIKGFTEEDFKIDGEWVQTCTETNLMYGLLEMCGEDRIGVIQQPIYLYNEKLPNGSIKRYGADEKHRIRDIFMARDKKGLFTEFTLSIKAL